MCVCAAERECLWVPGDQAHLLAGVFGFSLWIAVENKKLNAFNYRLEKRANKGRGGGGMTY